MKLWKKRLGKVDQIAIILGEPSDAFGTLNQGLLLAKLEAYSFSATSLDVVQNYLGFRGLFFCQFLLNSTAASFLLLINKNLSNWPHRNVSYTMNKNFDLVKPNPEEIFIIMRRCFYENHMI